MDNNYQKNSKQINPPNANQPAEQNDNLPNNINLNSSYNTYSYVPEIFNNKDAVSQNRNIPSAYNSTKNSNSQIRQSIQNDVVPNQPTNNSNIKNRNRVSDGRAFAEEFYPQVKPQQSTSNANTHPNIQQPLSGIKPQANTNTNIQSSIDNVTSKDNTQVHSQQYVDNKNLSNNLITNSQLNTFNTNNSTVGNIIKPKKNDVRYNYKALTPPNKKLTSIIIATYVIAIIMLLVGVIGYTLTSDSSSRIKETFTNFLDNFDNIDIEDVFAYNSDEKNSNDKDSNVYLDDYRTENIQNQPLEENYSYHTRDLTYIDDYESSFELYLSVPDPSGFEFQESLSSDDLVVFNNEENNLTCKAKLTEGHSDNLNELTYNIMNPHNEDAVLNKIGYYPTSYGDAVIYQIKFDNRVETYSFVDVYDDVVFVISIVEFNYNDVADEAILATVEEILENIY